MRGFLQGAVRASLVATGLSAALSAFDQSGTGGPLSSIRDFSPIRESQAAPETTPAPEGASAWIVSPKDGDTVPKNFKVVFGLTGFGVAPAGVNAPNTGHHHLLIDTELADYSRPIPADEQHRHFGKGQTEVELELLPGQHTLQLVLGDYVHRPHDPPVQSPQITVFVAEE